MSAISKFLLAAALLSAGSALAQNPTCPTRPAGDNSNACASTAFVQNSFAAVSSIIITSAPSYIYAGNTLAAPVFIPLDTQAHTVPASKQFDHIAIRQTSGGNNQFTVGTNALAEGISVFMESLSGSDSTSNLYGGVFNITNDGPGTAKAIHNAAFAATGSTGVTIAVSAGVTPVSTSSTGSSAIDAALVSNTGINGVASGLSIRSTGDQLNYGVGNVIAAVPIKTAFYQAWMASTSAAGARAFQVLNNAGSEIAYIDKNGLFQSGLAGTQTGSMGFSGATSGTATVTAQATANTPTLTLPNASGTFAISASTPLAIDSGTGNISWTGLTNHGLLVATSTTSVATSTVCNENDNQLLLTCTASTTGTPAIIVENTDADPSGASFVARKQRNGAAVQSGDDLGGLQFQPFSGSAYGSGGYIRAIVDGTPSGSNVPTRFEILNSSAAGLLNSTWHFDSAGHLDIDAQPNAVTITAGCNGSGSSVTTGTTDFAGTIIGQTAAATSCTLTWGTAYNNHVHCTPTGQTSAITSYTTSLTTLVVNFASTSNFKFDYQCDGS